MANVKVEQLGCGSPVVLTYEVEEVWEGLNVLRFEEYSEEWTKFILLNRNNPTSHPVHGYDIVIGPIADDRVGGSYGGMKIILLICRLWSGI